MSLNVSEPCYKKIYYLVDTEGIHALSLEIYVLEVCKTVFLK